MNFTSNTIVTSPTGIAAKETCSINMLALCSVDAMTTSSGTYIAITSNVTHWKKRKMIVKYKDLTKDARIIVDVY